MIASMVLAAAADRVVAPSPKALSEPMTWFSADDYPPSALRERHEGRVQIALDVSSTGAVTGCRILASSGFAELDGQTCASALQHARFSPATDPKGKPVASTFFQATRWVVPADRQADEGMGPFGGWAQSMNMVTATATVDVDAGGQVLRCKVTRAANTTVDPCMAFGVGKRVVAPTTVDGKPVPATITVMTIISVKPTGEKAPPVEVSP